MEIKDRVLVVEDDKRISNFIKTVLEANNYDVIVAQTGAEAYSMVTSQCPDVVILDLGLPDMDGMKILQGVREWSSMPVIVVSARTHERDKVEALDLGADDYITKPFGTSELLARIRTAIRHTRAGIPNQPGGQTGVFKSGGLTIDYDKHRVFIDGVDAGLTQNEYKIVSLLGKYAGKVMTYDYIIKEIWGPNMKNDNRILRVNMANIPIFKRHIFLNVATDNRLHSFQGVVDLDHLGVFVRLHKQDGNLSVACFHRLLAERFVERNRLEPDTVHEVEAGIQGIALPDFDYIRYGKRASLVVGRMVNIELLIDVFEEDAVHFAVINSVVSGCVDFLSAFDSFEGFHSDEAHIGGIPVHIDLINAKQIGRAHV